MRDLFITKYYRVLVLTLLLVSGVNLAILLLQKGYASYLHKPRHLPKDGDLFQNSFQHNQILEKWQFKLQDEDQEIKPLDSIYFLKTHKTGSSTLQGILMRYGDTRNLTFGLHYGTASLRYPQHFKQSFVRQFKNKSRPLDIICHHLRHSNDVLKVLKPEAKAVTLIRDPTYNFISAFKYYQHWSRSCFGTGDIDMFLEKPMRYTRDLNYTRLCSNRQLFDLGMKPQSSHNMNEVSDKIHEIEKTFDLVMIAEHFRESLILLKNLMNWSFQDILYFSKNVQNKKTTEIDKTYPKAYKIIKRLNSGDELMYHYFNRTFWKIIEMFGRDKMDRELAVFNKLQGEMETLCIKEEVEGRDKNVEREFKAVYLTNRVNAYILTDEGKKNETCRKMLMYEVQYTNHLRRKMTDLIF